MTLYTNTAASQIEVAIRQVIAFALRARKPVVADAAALRAVPTLGTSATTSIVDEQIELRPVTSLGACVQFDNFSTAADNGTSVIKPTDRTGPGRWLLTTASLTGGLPGLSAPSAGYLKAVRLYQGESTVTEIIARLGGSFSPSVLIKWIGEDHAYAGGDPGGLYKYRPQFEIWAYSTNLRSGNEALLGSSVPSEAAIDPGVNRIIGDLKVILGGSSLGNLDGVDFAQIGRSTPLLETLSQRHFLHKLALTVYATVQNPDTDDVTPTELTIQPQLGYLDRYADAADPTNIITSGLTVPIASGLTQTVAAGVATVAGIAVAPAATAHTFAASSATYRDLSSSGAWAFVAVPLGQEEPPVTAASLRIGITVTDAANVVDDVIVAASLVNVGSLITITP